MCLMVTTSSSPVASSSLFFMFVLLLIRHASYVLIHPLLIHFLTPMQFIQPINVNLSMVILQSFNVHNHSYVMGTHVIYF